jgi:hypothetical protein
MTGYNNGAELSGHANDGRLNKSEKSKLTRQKTPKKSKGSPSASRISESGDLADVPNGSSRKRTSVHTPVKKIAVNSASYPTAECSNTSLIGGVALPLLSAQSSIKRYSLLAPEAITNDGSPQLKDSLNVESSHECPQMNSTASSAHINTESVLSSGAECIKVPDQLLSTCEDITFHKETVPSNTEPAIGLATTIITIPEDLDQPTGPKQLESTAEPMQQQNKKNTKNKRKSASFSKRGSIEIVMEYVVRPTPDVPMDDGTKGDLEAETKSHAKIDTNPTSSGTTSGQGTQSKKEKRLSTVQRAGIDETTSLDGTPPKVHTRQSHQSKKCLQSKSNDGDDVFQDKRSDSIQRRRNPERKSQGKVEMDGSTTPSTGKTNSTTKKTRAQKREESPTPSGKTLSRVRKSKNDNRVAVPDRKENKKPVPSPTEILSDPSHWPALGSTRLQAETKLSNSQTITSSIKLLGERTLQPALLGRDSMASVVSNSSQPQSQPIRRLT